MTTTAFDLARTLREVRRAGETFGVLLRRTYPVSVERLWQACTDTDSLSRWLGRIEGDPAGGEVALVMPGGPDGEVRTHLTVLRCDRPRRLDLLWSFEGADSAVAAMIEPDGSGARLTIEHYALAEESGSGYGPGWDELLADLEDVLAGRHREHVCADLERECRARWLGLPRLTDHRFGEIDRDAGRYTVTRRYPVGADRLWRALTTSGGLSGWFGSVSGRLEPTGEWRVDFSGGYAFGRVLRCDPGRSFRATYRQGVDPADAGSHEIEVIVDEVGGESRLTLTHVYPVDAGERLMEGLAAGWVAHLNGLGSVLDSSVPDERGWLADFTTSRLVHRRATASTTG